MSVLLIASNSAWNIINFRSGLLSALIAEGHEVIVCCPNDPCSSQIIETGAKFVPLAFSRDGLNPLSDLLLLAKYVRILRRYRPDYILAFTAKPNIYAGLAARFCGVKSIHNITGLGSSFIKGGLVWTCVKTLYKLALRSSAHIFVQNPDDKFMFEQQGFAQSQNISLLPGSGIDVDKFQPSRTDTGNKVFRFLMVSRLIAHKGVREYAEAASILKAKGVHCECCLLGGLDNHNPSNVSFSELEEWQKNKGVIYLGETDNPIPYYQAANCVVLPSYHEGAPRTLIEAGALGLPSVTTDVPGCRFVVQDGKTGLTAKARDAHHLADKMLEMFEMSEAQRDQMGKAARARIVAEFSEEKIISSYKSVIECS